MCYRACVCVWCECVHTNNWFPASATHGQRLCVTTLTHASIGMHGKLTRAKLALTMHAHKACGVEVLLVNSQHVAHNVDLALCAIDYVQMIKKYALLSLIIKRKNK